MGGWRGGLGAKGGGDVGVGHIGGDVGGGGILNQV